MNGKRAYSKMGFATASFFVAWYVFVIIASLILAFVYNDISYDQSLIISMAGEVVLAAPIFFLIAGSVDKKPIEKKKLGAGNFFTLLAILFFLSIVGSIIANIINLIFNSTTGATSSAGLDELFDSNMVVVALDTVIIAPLLEELVFRKFLIDRVGRYGQRVAIFVSGILFGLAHGNFEQFFYAFFIGTLFAYVYIKTGRIIYSIILHFILNGSSVLLVVVMNYIPALDTDDYSQVVQAILNDSTQAAAFLIMMLILFVEYGAAIAGLVLFIIKRKDVSFDDEVTKAPYVPGETYPGVSDGNLTGTGSDNINYDVSDAWNRYMEELDSNQNNGPNGFPYGVPQYRQSLEAEKLNEKISFKSAILNPGMIVALLILCLQFVLSFLE